MPFKVARSSVLQSVADASITPPRLAGETGKEPSETAEGSTEEEHKETDSSTEICLDEYLKNHKVSSESTEESQDNNKQAEEPEADTAESDDEPETESAEIGSNFDTDNDTDVDTSSVVVYTLDDNEDDLINSDEADEI